jgi:hypothetical protein
MPRRPLPVIPRGPRRRRVVRERLLFACPRVSPDWELSTLSALMKPTPGRRGALEHRSGEQAWGPAAEAGLAASIQVVRERFGAEVAMQRAEGEYHFVAEYAPAQAAEFRALALILSRTLPELWFTLDRLFVHGGVFYRRQFGYKLKLVPASDVHLPRAVRAALRGALPPCPTPSSAPSRSAPTPAAR